MAEVETFLKRSAKVSKLFASGTYLGLRNKETPYG